jgi:hypothetical protein
VFSFGTLGLGRSLDGGAFAILRSAVRSHGYPGSIVSDASMKHMAIIIVVLLLPVTALAQRAEASCVDSVRNLAAGVGALFLDALSGSTGAFSRCS